METKILISLGSNTFSNVEFNVSHGEVPDYDYMKAVVAEAKKVIPFDSDNAKPPVYNKKPLIGEITEKQEETIRKYAEKYKDMIIEFLESYGKLKLKELTKDEASILIDLIFNTENAYKPEEEEEDEPVQEDDYDEPPQPPVKKVVKEKEPTGYNNEPQWVRDGHTEECPACSGSMSIKSGVASKTGKRWYASACDKKCGQGLVFITETKKEALKSTLPAPRPKATSSLEL